MKLKQTYGFTLPELMVVLIVMGLLLSMVMPSLTQSYLQLEMDAAITQLHKDIRWAQRLADREQTRVSIMFYRDSQPYRYVIRLSGDATILRKRTLPDGLSTLTAATIFIEPDKTFQKNGHVMLEKGDSKRYVYYYQTGRSRVSANA